MKWLLRLGCLIVVCTIVSSGTIGCSSADDTGTPCTLALEESKASLTKAAKNGEDARIIERTFVCEFTYCIANFQDANNPDKGYCTRICTSVADCPDDTNYKCEPFVQVTTLPKEFTSLSNLVGKKLCLKIPPSQTNQGNQ